MVYSYTQISHYLTCPRRYRHRYLDGWQEKDNRDDRVRIRQPRRSLQIKFTRPISENNEFVAYIDAIGKLDGSGCLLEWKTTSSRYPEEPAGLLALDPQLVCYSWIVRARQD